jgi:hypothetical protein
VVHRVASPFAYRFDRRIETRRELFRFGLLEAPRFDVLHALGGGSWLAYTDLAFSRLRGGTAVMQYNGSDCRTSDVARRLHPARARIVDPSRDRSVRLHRRLSGLASSAAVVQDLELVDYLRGSHRRIYVAPFAIDLDAIERMRPTSVPSASDRVRVFHAPSSRRIKGSDAIEREVAAAAEEAPIDFVTLTARPNREVLEGIASSDVVIDQLNAEVPGVFSAEAMALEKPVLCECDPRKLASFARPCPVVPITEGTLRERLLELASDPDRRRELGEEGRLYATTLHDPDRAARAAERVYAHGRTAAPGVYEADADSLRRLTSDR